MNRKIFKAGTKIITLLSIISLYLPSISFTGICGDVNNDNANNILDITYLINYLYQGGPGPNCGQTTGTFKDIDGNEYQVIKIGSQWWMAENLKVTHYRNGDPIPEVTDSSAWSDLYSGAYCNYDNHEGNASVYGRLYNWLAVNDSRNIAPEGWHVPSDAEWQTLVNYLGGNTVAGGKMKETGTVHWNSPNTGATNESGFTALPGGGRASGLFGSDFDGMGEIAAFWSSTSYSSNNAWARFLEYEHAEVNRAFAVKRYGLSVRCVTQSFGNISCGDVNDDGLINILDITYLISYLYLGGPAPWCECGVPIIDIDGNVYQTVLIGDQCWMMENLKVTHYRNGDPIPNVTDLDDWIDLTTGAYCEYNNDPANVETYGRLYNWFAGDDSRNIAPDGWHVPSLAEWQTLVDYLGGDLVAGEKLKEAGTAHWTSPNVATNESGFTALPGGYRGYIIDEWMFEYGFFWASTECPWEPSAAASIGLVHYDAVAVLGGYGGKYAGKSVRCIRD
jgi:uncharacterized protein (TIGR02145 family)